MALHTIVEHDTAHIKPYVDAKISSVKQALSNEVTTRATLGAHNSLQLSLADIKSYTGGAGWVNNVYTANGVSFTVNSDYTITVNTAGAEADTLLALFIANVDHGGKNLSFYTGYGNSSAYLAYQYRDSSNNMVKYGNIETNSDVTVNVPSSAVKLNLFIQVKQGAVLNNVVFKPTISDETDPYKGFTPYAMTNRELTENKTEKSDLTSINITGTTNTTGSTIASGTNFYLNGQLVRAKTAIASGATFTANTNYENAYVADVLDNPIAIKEFTNSSLVLNSTEGGQRIAGNIAINGYKPVSAIITYIGGDFNGSSLALCPYLVDDSYIFAHYKTTGATGTAEVKTRVIYVKDKVYIIK